MGAVVLSGSEPSKTRLGNASVCTVDMLLSHIFVETNNNLNQHDDFPFNRH